MNKQTILVPRGANVGDAIKTQLTKDGKYGKVSIFIDNVARLPKKKLILVIISYTWF